MNMKRVIVILAIGLVCLFLLEHTGTTRERTEEPLDTVNEVIEYRVSQLHEDNLMKNPWFHTGHHPSLDHWVKATPSDGGWGASQKPGNPTPDEVVGTAARISTGRGANNAGRTVEPGVDTYLYQVVSANPEKRILKFDVC